MEYKGFRCWCGNIQFKITYVTVLAIFMDYKRKIKLQGLTWYLDSMRNAEYKATAIFDVSKSDTLVSRITHRLKG